MPYTTSPAVSAPIVALVLTGCGESSRSGTPSAVPAISATRLLTFGPHGSRLAASQALSISPRTLAKNRVMDLEGRSSLAVRAVHQSASNAPFVSHAIPAARNRARFDIMVSEHDRVRFKAETEEAKR